MPARKSAAEALTNKTCKQMTQLVYDYLKGALGARVKRDFMRHLAICPDCVSFLNTYKKTVQITGSVRVEEMPARVRDNILAFLRRRARRNRTSA
jgi:hypothetical protein